MPFSPAPPPPPSPPVPLRARRNLQTPLLTPASGYVYDFQVHATFIWESERLYQDQLTSAIDALMPYAVRRVRFTAAKFARLHPPHRAHDLEVELQDALKDAGPWSFEWRGMQTTCQAYAWVELDDRVKQAVQPYWEQLIKLDCEHDVELRRAEYAEQRSRQWTGILSDLMTSPLADGAAEMTEKGLAEVVRKIVEERNLATEKLEGLMAEKAAGGDLFEQSHYFDALRERLERRADHMFKRAEGPPATEHNLKAQP